MKKRLEGLTVGILIGATITGGAVFGASRTKTIEVLYNNIKVYKDNVLCELKDANGTTIELKLLSSNPNVYLKKL